MQGATVLALLTDRHRLMTARHELCLARILRAQKHAILMERSREAIAHSRMLLSAKVVTADDLLSPIRARRQTDKAFGAPFALKHRLGAAQQLPGQPQRFSRILNNNAFSLVQLGKSIRPLRTTFTNRRDEVATVFHDALRLIRRERGTHMVMPQSLSRRRPGSSAGDAVTGGRFAGLHNGGAEELSLNARCELSRADSV
jgi:hypothetical protein